MEWPRPSSSIVSVRLFADECVCVCVFYVQNTHTYIIYKRIISAYCICLSVLPGKCIREQWPGAYESVICKLANIHWRGCSGQSAVYYLHLTTFDCLIVRIVLLIGSNDAAFSRGPAVRYAPVSEAQLSDILHYLQEIHKT